MLLSAENWNTPSQDSSIGTVCDMARDSSTVKLLQIKIQDPSLARVPSKVLGRDQVICSHGHTFLKICREWDILNKIG